ncbi:hypothetical protein ScPMuIL_015821 [Solemya velum]
MRISRHVYAKHLNATYDGALIFINASVMYKGIHTCLANPDSFRQGPHDKSIYEKELPFLVGTDNTPSVSEIRDYTITRTLSGKGWHSG